MNMHEDVADPDAFVSSLWISAEGGGVGELSGRFEGQTSWSPVPDKPRQYHVWLSATASNAEGRLAPLGEKIDAGKLETRWRLNRLKGAENKPVWSERSAVNSAFVTGAAAADAFHTVVDIGCEGGNGKSSRVRTADRLERNPRASSGSRDRQVRSAVRTLRDSAPSYGGTPLWRPKAGRPGLPMKI